MLVKLDHFSRDRGENKNINLKPQPSLYPSRDNIVDSQPPNIKERSGTVLESFKGMLQGGSLP